MNAIVCPNCGKEISEAFKLQIEKEIEEKAEKRIKDQLELKFKDSQNELEEIKQRKQELQNELLEMNKSVRELKESFEKKELEAQKKINQEIEQARVSIEKSEKEKANFEILSLRKKLEDTEKSLQEAQRKAQQGSQQLQGEVLELELEKLLSDSFPQDEVEPVAKGVTGADIKQIVKSPKGTVCGVILWESKRTKEWSDKWLTKLKEDLRNQKANIPIIVSVVLPKEAKDGFGIKEGVWICNNSLVLPIATILRKNLLDVGYQKAVSLNRGEKADMLYSYITSHDFQQQVERIVEVYKEMKDQIITERKAYERSWKQRETQAERIIMSTANIVGNMQGRVGASMPVIKGLELSDSLNNNQQKLLE